MQLGPGQIFIKGGGSHENERCCELMLEDVEKTDGQPQYNDGDLSVLVQTSCYLMHAEWSIRSIDFLSDIQLFNA